MSTPTVSSPTPSREPSTEPNRAGSRHRLLGLVGLVVLVVLVVAGMWQVADDEPLPGIARTPPLEASGLEFVDYALDDTGEVRDLVPAEGEVTLAYFGFLSCPDVCPTTMADIRSALARLDPEVAERVTVSFVTVDPERDTGSDVRDYLGLFFDEQAANVAALRADAGTDIDDAAAQLGVTYQVADHPPGDERYDVAHSAITYVIDDTATVVRELPFGATAEEFAQVIQHTLVR